MNIMSASSSPLSLASLCNRLGEVTTKRGICLNESLEIVQQDRNRAHHNAILTAIMLRLEAEIPSAQLSPNILVTLHRVVAAYASKMEVAQTLEAKKNRGKINHALVEKIFAKIKELHSSVQQLCALPQNSQPQFYARPPDPSSERQQMKSFLEIFFTNECILKAAQRLGLTIDAYVQFREQIRLDGNRIINAGDVDVCLPAQKYLDLPGPLFLLECRLSYLMEKNIVRNMEEVQRVMKKFYFAQLRFAKYARTLSGLLLRVKSTEVTHLVRKRMADLINTIADLRARYRPEHVSKAVTKFAKEIFEVIEEIKLFKIKKTAILFQKFNSLDEDLQAKEALSALHAALTNKIGTICSTCDGGHTKSDLHWFSMYAAAYVQVSKPDPSSHHDPKKTEGALLFYSRLRAGIFDKRSDFYSSLPKMFPSPQEILAMEEISNAPPYVSVIDTVFSELEAARSSPEIRPDTKEFLPKPLRSPPRVKKRTLQPISKRASPSPTVHKKKPQIVSKMEQLMISPPQPLPLPLATAVSGEPQQRQGSASSSDALETMTTASQATETAAAPTPALPSDVVNVKPSFFSFCVGSGPNVHFQYAWHVRRWWSPQYNPLVQDPCYSTKQFSPPVLQSIIFHHTIGLALIPVVMECGQKFTKKDEKGRTIRESYTLPSDVQWTDGSNQFERGVITVAFDPTTREFFHVGFSLKAPSTMRDEYLRDGYFLADVEEPSELVVEPHVSIKTLPDDGSRVETIDDFGVTVIDPKNHVRFETYFM